MARCTTISGNTSGLDFTGDTQDTVAGSYDTPNREQNPNQGRWISPDPAGLGAADFNNAQTLNRYSYVANYPLTETDPTGMDMSGWGYDTWDPGSSHGGPGSLLDAFVAAVEAVREGEPLPLPGERFNSEDYNPFEGQAGLQPFSMWAASAAFVQAQNNDPTAPPPPPTPDPAGVRGDPSPAQTSSPSDQTQAPKESRGQQGGQGKGERGDTAKPDKPAKGVR